MTIPEPHSGGPPDSVRTATAVLRTRRHAEMLFDDVVSLLGDAAYVTTANHGAIRNLFRRDPDDPSRIVPWPLLELRFGGRVTIAEDWMVTGDTFAVPPEPARAPAPRLRHLGPGEIRLLDGDEHVEVAYADDGAVLETCRSHQPAPLAGLASACAVADGNPIELLARWVTSLDPGRHGPGRVLLPTATPNGPAGVWNCGLRALRGILFDAGAPRGAAWAVVDGLTGAAVAFGATAQDALLRWRAEVVARPPWPQPRPAVPPPDDEELPPGTVMLRAPAPDVPMPDRKPENVPAAIVPLAPAPARPPGFGSWTALLGARGASQFAACRRRRQGFTLIGQHVLAGVDPDRLAAEMDRVDREHEARMRDALAGTPGGVRRWPCRTTTYRVLDGGRLAFAAGDESPAWQAGALDGDVVAHGVVRQRWHGQGMLDADA